MCVHRYPCTWEINYECVCVCVCAYIYTVHRYVVYTHDKPTNIPSQPVCEVSSTVSVPLQETVSSDQPPLEGQTDSPRLWGSSQDVL